MHTLESRTFGRGSKHVKRPRRSRAWQPHCSILLLLAFIAVAAPVQAAAISYSLTDLGGGAWRYSYRVSGVSFAAFGGFEVYFDPTLYEALDPFPAPPNADWFVFTTQPDPSFPPPFGNGSYTASALVDNASLTDPFVVSFTFLGPGEPGSQPFAIFDPFFNIIGTGTTVATSIVPEPNSFGLLCAALFGIPIARAVRRNKQA